MYIKCLSQLESKAAHFCKNKIFFFFFFLQNYTKLIFQHDKLSHKVTDSQT